MSVEEVCEALTDLVARAAAVGPGDRVLEVGCGYGANAVYYTTRYRPVSAVGIDMIEVRIQNGRDFIASKGLADVIRLQTGNAPALDFPKGAFTKVLAFYNNLLPQMHCDTGDSGSGSPPGAWASRPPRGLPGSG